MVKTHWKTATFHCLYVKKLSISKNRDHCALVVEKSVLVRQHLGKRAINLQRKKDLHVDFSVTDVRNDVKISAVKETFSIER